MAHSTSVKHYYDTDFHGVASIKTEVIIGSRSAPEERASVDIAVYFDYDANAKYFAWYYPRGLDFRETTTLLLEARHFKAISLALGSDGCFMLHRDPSERLQTSSTAVHFCGRIFIYTEDELASEDFTWAVEVSNQLGFCIGVRDAVYAAARSQRKRPAAFICHAKEDKDALARPIAAELSRLDYIVWFDEYTLKPGDDLREMIESGIRECRKCIVLLTPNFISNRRWARREFDSIVSRELIKEGNVLIPIWSDVSEEQVYEFSPSLLNRLAITCNIKELTEKEITRLCHELIRTLGPPTVESDDHSANNSIRKRAIRLYDNSKLPLSSLDDVVSGSLAPLDHEDESLFKLLTTVRKLGGQAGVDDDEIKQLVGVVNTRIDQFNANFDQLNAWKADPECTAQQLDIIDRCLERLSVSVELHMSVMSWAEAELAYSRVCVRFSGAPSPSSDESI